MRVSVIIPCYRDADTLGRALASLQAQTRRPEEVLVVDDHSPETDRILAVIARFPGVRCVRNETNLGLAGARNRGIADATGDILAFLDADDECHPQRLEWQLAQVGPRIAVACDTARVTPGTAAPKTTFVPPARVREYRGVGLQAYANRLTGASLMAPAALLRQVGGYDPALRSCEDLDLWLRLLSQGVLVRRILQPLYLYHDNPAGLSRRYADIARWELAVIEKFIRGGSAGPTRGWRAGTLWATWLARHFSRAARLRDPQLQTQAEGELYRLAPWPLLRAALRVVGRSRLLGGLSRPR